MDKEFWIRQANKLCGQINKRIVVAVVPHGGYQLWTWDKVSDLFRIVYDTGETA